MPVVIERIAEMPQGSLGFHASETLTREDFTDVLLPPIREAVNGGVGVRLLFVAGSEMGHLEPAALWEDLKAEVDLGLRHPSAWKRVAIATDLGWIRRMMSMFGWMAPGETKVFAEDQVEAAKLWVVA